MSFDDIIKSVDDFLGEVLNKSPEKFIQKKVNKTQLSESQEKILEERFDGKWQNPIKGTYYNSGAYQMGDKRHNGVHNGVDLRAPGGTSIYPIAPGFIENAATWEKGGNILTILHPYGVRVYMAHLGVINVKVGDFVDKDTIIAGIGNSGNAHETIPHLHIEIRINGSLVNPNKFIDVPPYTEFNSLKENIWLSDNHKQNANKFKFS